MKIGVYVRFAIVSLLLSVLLIDSSEAAENLPDLGRVLPKSNYVGVETISIRGKTWRLAESGYYTEHWRGVFSDDADRKLEARVWFGRDEEGAGFICSQWMGEEFERRPMTTLKDVDEAVWMECLPPWLSSSQLEPPDRPHRFAVKARRNTLVYVFFTEIPGETVEEFAKEFLRVPKFLLDWKVLYCSITATVNGETTVVHSEADLLERRRKQMESKRIPLDFNLPTKAKRGQEVTAHFQVFADLLEITSDGFLRRGLTPLEGADVIILKPSEWRPYVTLASGKSDVNGKCSLSLGEIESDFQFPVRIGWGKVYWGTRINPGEECQPIQGHLNLRYGREIEEYLDTFTYPRVDPPGSASYEDVSEAMINHIKAIYSPDNAKLPLGTKGDSIPTRSWYDLRPEQAIVLR